MTHEHGDRRERALAEAPRDRAQRLAVGALEPAERRHDRRGEHELAADEERHREQMQPAHRLPHAADYCSPECPWRRPYTDKTDEQQAICEMVRQFADEQIIPNAEHYDAADEFPEPIVAQMRELGLFGVTIPEEYGGMGLDLTTYAMIVEELSRGWISISGIVNTHFIGSYLLMKFGTEEQRQKFLPRMATGEIRAAFSLSEPELGSDVQAIKTSAKRVDGGAYEINGQKMWVTNGLLSVARVRARQDRPEGRSAPPRHDLLHRREGAGRRPGHGRVRRASTSRRRSRSSATRASSRPSWSSTATAARPRTSSAARTPASTRASRR